MKPLFAAFRGAAQPAWAQQGAKKSTLPKRATVPARTVGSWCAKTPRKEGFFAPIALAQAARRSTQRSFGSPAAGSLVWSPPHGDVGE